VSVAGGQQEQQEPAREPVWRTIETKREPEDMQLDKRELKDILAIMRDSSRLQEDQEMSEGKRDAERGYVGGGEGEGIEGMVRKLESAGVMKVTRALPHPPTLPLAVPYGSAYTYAAPLPLYVPVAYQERGGGGGVGAAGDEAALYDKIAEEMSEHTARYWAKESGRQRDHPTPSHTAWAERDHSWAGHPALQHSAGNCNM
jgi:hypothetical protein